MKRYLTIALAVAAAYLSACNSTATKPIEKADTLAAAKQAVIGDTSTNELYVNYIQLKDALVKSDTAAASQAAALMAATLTKVDGCEAAADLATNIASPNSLAEQRKDFVLLNSEVIPVIKHAKLVGGNIFVQYCPMANDSKGAFWLASEKEIRNPYYGDEMLNCGEVKEVIK